MTEGSWFLSGLKSAKSCHVNVVKWFMSQLWFSGFSAVVHLSFKICVQKYYKAQFLKDRSKLCRKVSTQDTPCMGFQRSKTISTFWVILRGYQQGQWLSSLRLIWNWPAVFDYCYGVSPGQQNTKARLYYTPLHKRRSSRAVINVQFHHSKSRCGIFFYYLRTLVKFMVNFSLELIDHQMYSITLSQDIIDRIVRKLNWMGCPRPILGLKYR